MSKDPAFLFYPNDWLGGTITFTVAQKGAYMDLLMVQFNQGSLSIDDVKHVLGTNFWMWDTKLKSKFIEKDGLYFNPRLQKEVTRRSAFTESRRKNRTSYVEHMENRNENENIISNLTPREETEKFMEMINQNSAEYVHFLVEFAKRTGVDENIAGREVKKFADYWCERTGNGKKMRWETEKTFEIQRRLKTWFGNASQWSKEKKLSKTKQFVI